MFIKQNIARIPFNCNGADQTSGEQDQNQGRQPNTKVPLPPRRKGQITPKRHTREMEFLHEKKDYNVAEFYEHFHNDLPKTVMVNQGFCGEIVEDTFDREQVLRVHAISKQRRVIAKFQYGSHSRMISIPVTYEENLCVVKQGGKHGKPKQMYTILKENTLPLTVQFPKDHSIAVGSQTVSTNNIPCMELVQTFDEVYLLSNFITDGVMSQEVVHVPLYLSQLRLALITGIKGQPKEKWTGYQQELDRAAAYIEFDQEFGNPNIAEYDPSAIHSDTTYSYVEPKVYSNIVSLVHKSPFRSFDNATYNPEQHRQDEGPSVYEEIDNTARDDHGKHDKHNKHMKPHVNTAFQKELDLAMKSEVPQDSTPQLTSFKPQPQKTGAPPPLAPKPHVSHTVPEPERNTNSNSAPSLPERKAIPEEHKSAPTSATKKALYYNDVPRTTISPTKHVAKESELKSPPAEVRKIVREVKCPEDISKLTIDEVSEYLKKLNLEKYADNFKREQIDGPMLADLDRNMLREDFGMKGVEALRLIKFAKEGHLPT
ncbi:uncharacterized protein LOC123540204 isoform X2 [Mercenaria mercenaria]|uniref:uncharacterized protein LOC123540204 isoform X2 n=1 Tax=Mercenaria mercenaria TaxID=6596 RepID=UPI00234E8932|nr:uncharacterized protein LOC123540204 isoform X2 [Mercenaria mercenaria]